MSRIISKKLACKWFAGYFKSDQVKVCIVLLQPKGCIITL